MNGYKSNLADVKYRVPQVSILGPLLLLIYINDLHLALKHSKVHQFADDSNLLNSNSSVNPLTKKLIMTQKKLSKLVKANKISHYVSKNESGFFTSPKKQLDIDLKIKLNGKRLYETDSVKYLGIQIDKDVLSELKLHTGLLFKDSKILKSFDKTALENCIFISKCRKRLLSSVFNNFHPNLSLMVLDGQIVVT